VEIQARLAHNGTENWLFNGLPIFVNKVGRKNVFNDEGKVGRFSANP
jgi:hypothetical protein